MLSICCRAAASYLVLTPSPASPLPLFLRRHRPPRPPRLARVASQCCLRILPSHTSFLFRLPPTRPCSCDVPGCSPRRKPRLLLPSSAATLLGGTRIDLRTRQACYSKGTTSPHCLCMSWTRDAAGRGLGVAWSVVVIVSRRRRDGRQCVGGR